MEIAMSKCMKESEDELNMRKSLIKIKKKIDRFSFLPDDILLDILKRVPEASLRYAVKYVCKRWFHLVTNSILLYQASFILQHMQNRKVRLVDIREEKQGLQVKEQYIDIHQEGTIHFWCNELLLISSHFRSKSFYVLNLVTMEASYLPKCTGGQRDFRMALSFDRNAGIYKVVRVIMGPPYECEILVYGVSSKWKKIQFWPNVNKREHIWGDTVSVQGRYLHWRIKNSNDLLSVDMVEEKFTKIRLPGSRDRGTKVESCFEVSGLLAFFYGTTHLDNAGIWVLKDFRRKKWEKMRSITVSYNYFLKYGMYRFCGMTSKRYMILEAKADMYSYDLKNGVVKKLDNRVEHYDMGRVVHSLVSSSLY